MKVRELMTKVTWTCRPFDPLSDAAQLMWQHDIGVLPVLGADDKLVGIVTDRDVCMAAHFSGQPLRAIPVEQAMAKEVFTVAPEQDLDAAENLMRAKQVHRVPVVDAGKLVGIITLRDLARANAAHERQVTADEVSATYAAIAKPRRPVTPAA